MSELMNGIQLWLNQDISRRRAIVQIGAATSAAALALAKGGDVISAVNEEVRKHRAETRAAEITDILNGKGGVGVVKNVRVYNGEFEPDTLDRRPNDGGTIEYEHMIDLLDDPSVPSADAEGEEALAGRYMGRQRLKQQMVQTKDGLQPEVILEIVAVPFTHGRSNYTALDPNSASCYLPPADLTLARDISPNGVLQNLHIIARNANQEIMRDAAGDPINPGAMAPMK